MGKIVPKHRENTSSGAGSRDPASDRRPLHRKLGLETEYAICRTSESPQSFDFESFMQRIKQLVPCVPSSKNPYRYFLANGGCVSLELGSLSNDQGILIETSTPTCGSPMQLVEYQSALRELSTEAISAMTFGGTLLQGNHDASGHTYGQHESYEVYVARGMSLFGWRLGLALMLPFLLFYHGATAIWLFLIWSLARFFGRWKPFRSGAIKSTPTLAISPRWINACINGIRILNAPIAFMLWCNIQLFALRPYRKHLCAFFATRCLLDGAGHVDEAGRYWISHRAALTNCKVGFGSYGRSRPIFRCDSWLRELCMGPGFSWNRYLGMFSRRRRIEIAIGDSGLCDLSQYIRIGITSLAFDLAERNPSAIIPKLRRPIEALVVYAKDWMLLARAPDRNECLWRACEIQNTYATAVRKMLEDSTRVPDEAWRIVEQWQIIINQLEATDEKSEPPRSLVGRIDWITKLWILDYLNKEQATVDAKRKLDLRYHELSNQGYYRRVLDVVDIPRVVSKRGLERARYNPPVDDPGSIARSYLIREFSDESAQLTMDRDRAQWVSNGTLKTTRFH